MPAILLIDDEPNPLHALTEALAQLRGFDVLVASCAIDGVKLAAAHRPAIVLLDVHLPDQSGLDVFQELKRLDPAVLVVFVTVSGEADAAIAATKDGAFDYLFKPVELTHLERTLTAAFEVLQTNTTASNASPPALAELQETLIGRCPAMREVYLSIGRVAAQDVSVLVTGESGTGKELVARAIHQHSRRAEATYLAINCAAIPENLLESELFGHEKGAFTGADRRRIGKFEQCHGGTIFLDEIGDMPLGLQGKLLRVLQDGRFERVGGNETVAADIRVIAATHQNLADMVLEGRFRRDLFYRLNVVHIELPALRTRGEDIPLLVEHYRCRLAKQFGKDVRTIAPEAMQRLREYAWPGNVRELQSVLKRALLRANGSVLLASFLPAEIGYSATPQLIAPDWLSAFIKDRLAAGTVELWAEVASRVDEMLLPLVLGHTQGNQQKAAALLGVARQTLRTRLRDLGITARPMDEGDPVA